MLISRCFVCFFFCFLVFSLFHVRFAHLGLHRGPKTECIFGFVHVNNSLQQSSSQSGFMSKQKTKKPGRSNNNNNNRIERRNSRFLQSSHCTASCLHPTRTLKWLGCNRVQITCNTSSVYHVHHVMYHLERYTSMLLGR